ncbi:hypothetical protein EU527_17925, partial [Candidatus Thorarchaeota archaeon]
MRRNIIVIAFFVAIFGFSIFTPIVNETSNQMKIQYTETNSHTVAGIGDDLEDFVDQISNLHAPTDIGTHNVFSDLQDYGVNFNQMTEA